MDSNSASAGGTKIRRLAVVPSDPLQAYVEKGRADLLPSYYNPCSFFDEVYCLSPLEKTAGFRYGMHAIPTSPERFASSLRELEIDIVRAYGGYRACDLACQNKVDGVPVVVSVHDKRESWLHDSIHDADYVLSVSNAVRELLLARGVPSNKIYDFTNRVDLQVFRLCSDEKLRAGFCDRYPGKYRILHVGRRGREKNLDTLIRALPRLGPDYVCIFVGRGDETEYRRLAEQCGVGRRCHFIESVPNAELATYYSFCDCACTPSRSEGFGLVFIEALACEAVVVTSDIAPMNEYITSGVSGILVEDFEDPAALAEALVQACTDQQLRSTVRSNARKAAEPFSKDKIDRLEVSLYRQFLNDSVPKTKINPRVADNILRKNPWYVDSQFDWSDRPAIRPIYQKRCDFFLQCIDRAKRRFGRTLRMLDAGCGDGYWLHRFASVQGIELTGLDYNPLRVERARQAAPHARIHLGDIVEFVAEQPFDIILLSQVVEHVDDDIGLLQRVRTLLNVDGVLILGTPNEASSLHQLRRQRLGKSYKTDHVHFYAEDDICATLWQAGFRIDRVMREPFFIGTDDLYYSLLETEWGLALLEFMTLLVPTECSDFYFECRASAGGGLADGRHSPPEPPTMAEIMPTLEELTMKLEQIRKYRTPRQRDCASFTIRD
jgi:glycosyltransferase involved in cell wall biosynthesis/SAM-dependent methyltransferase